MNKNDWNNFYLRYYAVLFSSKLSELFYAKFKNGCTMINRSWSENGIWEIGLQILKIDPSNIDTVDFNDSKLLLEYLIDGVGEILSFYAQTIVHLIKSAVFSFQRVISG